MPETFPAASAVELAVVERSGFVESRHAGSAVVLAPDGEMIRALGDVTSPILPRSCLKPVQAVACLMAGVALAGEQLGLATASHSGTDRHVSVVTDILSGAGLSEDALLCPPALPTDAATRNELVRELGSPQAIRMNCSGKHAAMLAACVTNGWPTENYLDEDHPLQLHIREVAERLTGEKMTSVAIDGCGAPIFAMSLTALARALSRLGTSSTTSPFALHRHGAVLVKTVRENPWTIAGAGQPDTIAIEQLGVFSKFGAEGVGVMVAPDGTTVALKMLDGSSRATTAVALRLLEQADAVPSAAVESVLARLPLTISGGGRQVGSIRPVV